MPMWVGRVVAVGVMLAAGSHAEEHVFQGGVSVVRVDVQVLGASGAVGDLARDNFVVKENGKPQAIRYFSREEQPLDVLLLLDVSVSMGPHVSRMVETAHTALSVLRPGDRIAIMTFDRQTRMQAPLNGNVSEVRHALDETLHRENFKGGTDIHYGLFEAARYLRQNGRPEARRSIVILSDDQTEMQRKDALILRALWQADIVLCGLLTEVKFSNSRTESANIAGLAEKTGGDTIKGADAASSLKTALERIRQRYTLGFHVPDGLTPGATRTIQVDLDPETKASQRNVQVQARRGYVVPDPFAR